MNHALLTQLQRLRSYPSVTVLVNTTPRQPLNETERKTLETFVSATNRRLEGDVPLFVRRRVVERLEELVTEIVHDPASHALALCVSPDYSGVVRLGRAVEERVIVDDTFATRDLVADLNRTAHYRVITISDSKTRLLVGDRQRLLEERSEGWPRERAEGQNTAAWTKTVMQALQVEHQRHPLPTVVAVARWPWPNYRLSAWWPGITIAPVGPISIHCRGRSSPTGCEPMANVPWSNLTVPDRPACMRAASTSFGHWLAKVVSIWWWWKRRIRWRRES
jgi:hypothetical protein